MPTIGSNAMNPFALGGAAPAVNGTAGGAVFTPFEGSTGKGPEGVGGGPAGRPPPRGPPPPAPAAAASGVDHSKTVLNFGPKVSSSSFPLYISRIVARP